MTSASVQILAITFSTNMILVTIFSVTLSMKTNILFNYTVSCDNEAAAAETCWYI